MKKFLKYSFCIILIFITIFSFTGCNKVTIAEKYVSKSIIFDDGISQTNHVAKGVKYTIICNEDGSAEFKIVTPSENNGYYVLYKKETATGTQVQSISSQTIYGKWFLCEDMLFITSEQELTDGEKVPFRYTSTATSFKLENDCIIYSVMFSGVGTLTVIMEPEK